MAPVANASSLPTRLEESSACESGWLAMRRRDFVASLGLLAAPARGQGQGGKQYRVAIFHSTNPISTLSINSPVVYWRVLFEELRQLGYEEGHNLLVERYSANGQTNTYAEFAAHIVETRPDLIFTVGSLVAKRFATATDKIPSRRRKRSRSHWPVGIHIKPHC